MILRAAAVSLLLATPLYAQAVDSDRITAAVRAAMTPALPFPNTDAAGAVPADSNTDALWMVRPLEPGDRTIEVLANPLNAVNQVRATRAMAQIENNIQDAQRRASAQYDRAVAEAKRTGKSQEVDGVTLNDEGVAGAKIDADSHVTIDVASHQPSYQFEVPSAMELLTTVASQPGSSMILAVPPSTYRDEVLGGERYAEAQTFVFLGRMPAPETKQLKEHAFEVTAASDQPTLVVRLRGNEALIGEIVRKTNWNSLLELLK